LFILLSPFTCCEISVISPSVEIATSLGVYEIGFFLFEYPFSSLPDYRPLPLQQSPGSRTLSCSFLPHQTTKLKIADEFSYLLRRAYISSNCVALKASGMLFSPNATTSPSSRHNSHQTFDAGSRSFFRLTNIITNPLHQVEGWNSGAAKSSRFSFDHHLRFSPHFLSRSAPQPDDSSAFCQIEGNAPAETLLLTGS